MGISINFNKKIDFAQMITAITVLISFLVIPALCVMSYYYQYGYLVRFGLDHNLINISLVDLLINFYGILTYLALSSVSLMRFYFYLTLICVLLSTLLILIPKILRFISNKIQNKKLTDESITTTEKTKLDLSISIFISIFPLFIASILLFISFLGYFTFDLGMKEAQSNIDNYQLNNKTVNYLSNRTVNFVDVNGKHYTGLFIFANNHYIALYHNENTTLINKKNATKRIIKNFNENP